ncbi:MAG TPA: DUF4157 domain-containing protein [Rhodothermia bacterium]|nr:DUF4157 domain-containing protein [Rhodothermia bacterium]
MLPYVALTGLTLATLTVAAQEPPPDVVLGESTLSPLVAQALTPLLSDWIVQSRDAALAQGVRAIPAAIRSALSGYVPEPILERVRWRVGGAGETSVQENLFRFGYTPAVTLDYVVIFQSEKEALTDPKLWVHELKHVMQYADWGIPQFAARYLQDYAGVEEEAAEYRWQWMKQAGLIPPMPAAPEPTDG